MEDAGWCLHIDLRRSHLLPNRWTPIRLHIQHNLQPHSRALSQHSMDPLRAAILHVFPQITVPEFTKKLPTFIRQQSGSIRSVDHARHHARTLRLSTLGTDD
jgi:hypothetical protein